MPPKKVPKCSRMFPSLHQNVADAVDEHIKDLRYHETNNEKGVSTQYSTFVMGQFRCYNRSCPKVVWTSGKVAISIRKYQDDSYNAEVFKQRCKACNQLGNLKMDQQSYIDRVSYRLLKWARVAVEQPVYELRKTPPHMVDLCEGCKRGICRDADI